MNLIEIQLGLQSLAMFRRILQDKVVNALLCCLCESDAKIKRVLYCEFVHRLYQNGGNLGDYLLQEVSCIDTAAAQFKISGKPLPKSMAIALQVELDFLSDLSKIKPEDIAKVISPAEALPLWENSAHNFKAVYTKQLEDIFTKGIGIFAKYHVFTVDNDGSLEGVLHPDPQRFEYLIGYEPERKKAEDNSLALLCGKPAHNVLLYGDAGTGKSSTVKALANKYKIQGLRLVELRLNQLHLLTLVMKSLEDNPLKFIVFIDDISFLADDAGFNILKATLEGTVSARPENIAVYATSNRRQLVRQRKSDRQGDDLHLTDTLQEQASLAERFGVAITFLKPDKDLYAQIVTAYVQKLGLETDLALILEKAEVFALRKGGRSPRNARQFTEWLKANE